VVDILLKQYYKYIVQKLCLSKEILSKRDCLHKKEVNELNNIRHKLFKYMKNDNFTA